MDHSSLKRCWRSSVARAAVAARRSAFALTALTAALLAAAVMSDAAVPEPVVPEPVVPGAAVPAADRAGERIYRDGLLSDGSRLKGTREDGAPLMGSDAACVNCHQRSGLGETEGAIVVPPVTGRHLFESTAELAADVDAPHLPGSALPRSAYTDATLALAIRNGVAADGRALSYLMPRYSLGDADMAVLTNYLRHLAVAPPPGVEPDVLHFATIVTPEAGEMERDAMLEVLTHYIDSHNATMAPSQRLAAPDGRVVYRVQRRWQLAVWTLTGPPDRWARQLADYFRDAPVLAVVSGLGGRHWRPVHEFCETVRVACLLPNVPVPVVADNDFYPIYFSRGVLLEADLMKHELSRLTPRPSRVVEVYRTDTPGQDGAEALRRRLEPGGTLVMHALAHEPGSDLRADLAGGVRGAGADGVLVLWLSAADLAQLPRNPSGRIVLVSGLMGGLESAALPRAWRARTVLSYPVELPDIRRLRVAYTLGWLRLQHIAVRAERVQADTYLACQILGEALDSMLDSYTPEFLIERVQTMMSTRLVDGYYPRLGLGAGQRFGSKGGYLVRFPEPGGTVRSADAEWVVP